MAQPSGLPQWNTDGTNRTEPSTGQKETGWTSGQAPPSGYFNWWMYTVWLWISYLKDLAGEALTWTAAHTFQKGITVTQSTADGNGITATGNGFGAGINATGGANAPGAQLTGQGSNPGVQAISGAFGSGIRSTLGGSANANTNDRFAFQAQTGHYNAGGGNPDSDTAFVNTLTPSNIPKVWGCVSCGAGSPSVVKGFNIDDVEVDPSDSDRLRIHFASDFDDQLISPVINCYNFASPSIAIVEGKNAGYINVAVYSVASGGQVNLSSAGGFLDFVVFGEQ